MNPMPVAPTFQDDAWSCGIHASFRILKGRHGLPVDYAAMRESIGSFGTITVPFINSSLTLSMLGLRLGNTTTGLVEKLRERFAPPANSETETPLDRVRALLDNQQPVMCLCQVSSESKKLSIWPLPDFFVKFPILHWYVAVGHTPNSILVHDTYHDDIVEFENGEFDAMRFWHKDEVHSRVRSALVSSGVAPGDILYFG